MTRCPPATAPGATVPRGVPPVHPEEDRAIRLAAQAIWPARVRALLEADPGAVERVARAVVGDRAATLADWSVGPLPGGGGDNPASGGLYRVSGTVVTGRSTAVRARVPWSAVLKVVRSPRETGEPMTDPAHGNYWRREVEALASGLLDRLPPGLVPPRHYGWAEIDDGAAWLWVEDLGSLGSATWDDAAYHAAARHLATFHAAFLTGAAPLPTDAWLNDDYLRGFLGYEHPPIARVLEMARSGEPGLDALDPDRAAPWYARLVAILERPEPLLAALDRLPRTLCHHDTHIDNLLLRRRLDGAEELVAIDWQLVGRGPVGADLAQLLSRPPDGLEPVRRAEVERGVVGTYAEALAAAGARVDVPTVRFGVTATGLLRETCWEFFLLALDVLRRRREGPPPGRRKGAPPPGPVERVEAFLASLEASHLPDLASRPFLLSFHP